MYNYVEENLVSNTEPLSDVVSPSKPAKKAPAPVIDEDEDDEDEDLAMFRKLAED